MTKSLYEPTNAAMYTGNTASMPPDINVRNAVFIVFILTISTLTFLTV